MKTTKPIYIGNRATNEFHRVKGIKPECNADKITVKNRVEFRRGRDARQAGMDACAWCNSYWKSKDNR